MSSMDEHGEPTDRTVILEKAAARRGARRRRRAEGVGAAVAADGEDADQLPSRSAPSSPCAVHGGTPTAGRRVILE